MRQDIDCQAQPIRPAFKLRPTGCAATVFGLSLGLLPLAVQAQSDAPPPGQLVPKSFASEPAAPQFPDRLPASEPARPALGSEDRRLTLGRVLLQEAGVPVPAQVRALIASIEGRSQRLGDLYAAVSGIEQAYVDAGYFLTRVLIPPQTVKDGGDLQLRVLPGFIASIDSSALPERVQQRVRRVLAPLLGQRPLSRDEFERRLLLAGDMPGLTLRSSLSPGAEEGAVVLGLQGEHRGSRGALRFDNRLPVALGRHSASLSFSVDSPTEWGEQFYGSLGGSPRHDGLREQSPHRLAAAGAMWPIGIDGWSVNAEYVWSATHPRTDGSVIETQSDYQRASLRLNGWLLRQRSESLRARLTFDAVQANQLAPQFQALLYEDRLRVARFGLDWNAVWSAQTRVSASLDFSRGLRWLDSRSPNSVGNVPLSQPLGSDIFSKTEVQLQLHHALSPRFGLDLMGRGQTTGRKPLLLSEKFSMGGENDLSAGPTSSLSGDRGWVGRAELQWQSPWPVLGTGNALQLYGFGAHGRASTLAASALQPSSVRATDIGLGLRSSTLLSQQAGLPLDLQLELARERRSVTSSSTPTGVRLHVSAALSF